MRKTPALATALLRRAAPPEEALAGDVLEEYQSGRSRFWYWRQVVSAILLGTFRQVAAAPVGMLGAVATGWTTLLLVFATLGDTATEAVSEWVFGWERFGAYATQMWWPFQIVAVLVSYAGFALTPEA